MIEMIECFHGIPQCICDIDLRVWAHFWWSHTPFPGGTTNSEDQCGCDVTLKVDNGMHKKSSQTK